MNAGGLSQPLSRFLNFKLSPLNLFLYTSNNSSLVKEAAGEEVEQQCAGGL